MSRSTAPSSIARTSPVARDKAFSITGEPPANRVVILQFENMDKVKAWRDVTRDAQEKIGNKYAIFRTFAVEGVAQY
jgi:hypothetical protein